MKRFSKYFIFLFTVTILVSCNKSQEPKNETLFSLLTAEETHIDFQNKLVSTNDFNIYKYRNFYNGAGVGLGDIDNDGLIDMYLSGNMDSNKLYKNKGNFVFEDITEKSGVSGKGAWATGVSMVDINSDGWLDIYVCNSGDIKGGQKQNEFFINNGDGTFTDKAEEMGLADRGFSTHAAFFDYDNDGDLDMYQLNNSYRSIGSFNLKINERPIRDTLGGDKLYRNDKGFFKDVSEEAGIYGSIIGFGLGIAVSDLNKDGWQDLYISNDFFERDYIYMNNGNGTFTEDLPNQVKATSLTSMGVDAADLNGDGYPEIFVNDMLPETDGRYKTAMTFENWDKYTYNLKHGYYHQFTRNTLQLNNTVLNNKLTFSEIGRLVDVEATDWSWSVLLTDLDNNGEKDIYITNGMYQDILDQDFIQYLANDEVSRMVIKEDGVDYKKLIDLIPSHQMSNYVFSGNAQFAFKNVTTKWGLGTPSSSNGAAYGDLDNDGDLDLVVSNVNQPLFIYKNNAEHQTKNNYLKIKLLGEKENINAVGAKVTLKANGKMYYQEQYPNRGFQSSVDMKLNFGIGNTQKIDTLQIEWLYGKTTLLTNLEVNQTLTLSESDATLKTEKVKINEKRALFEEFNADTFIDFKHQEENYIDFDSERLLFQMNSTTGPKISIADVNRDGTEDVFIGGGKNQSAVLYIQKNGEFIKTNQPDFEKSKISEDVESLFFDADSDGDLDLYVASGSSEFGASSFALVDRLYFNDGRGNFKNTNQSLPVVAPQNTSTVKAADYDKDGDLDLFVGIRMKNGFSGVPQTSYLLENDGTGKFKNVNKERFKSLIDIGMVTDAVWSDYDNDNDKDLLVVGEWMGVKLFENNNGNFTDISTESGLEATDGWWNKIITSDFNNDGYPDFVIGNHGLNSRFKASNDKPISCYINDFDNNGTAEQIICQFNGDKQYPFILRHDLVMQIPSLKKNILKYQDYKGKQMNDLFSSKQLENAIVYNANMLESVIVLSNGNKTYSISKLPLEAQISPIYALVVNDFDKDGFMDILTGGNLYGVKPEVGRYDASYGTFLKGNGEGSFNVLPMSKTNILLDGEIRDFEILKVNNENFLIASKSNDRPQFFKINTEVVNETP